MSEREIPIATITRAKPMVISACDNECGINAVASNWPVEEATISVTIGRSQTAVKVDIEC